MGEITEDMLAFTEPKREGVRMGKISLVTLDVIKQKCLDRAALATMRFRDCEYTNGYLDGLRAAVAEVEKLEAIRLSKLLVKTKKDAHGKTV